MSVTLFGRLFRWAIRLAVATLALSAGLAPVVAGAQSEPAAASAIAAARRDVASGALPSAIAHLRAYVAAHATEIEPQRYLGDLEYRAGDLKAAESTFRAIVVLAPHDGETHNRLGGLYAAEDRIPEALAEFAQSLPVDGTYGHLVELHRHIGDLDQFVAKLRHAADLVPYEYEPQYAAGVVLRATHAAGDALPYLERARALRPRDCAVMSELGTVYLDVRRYDDAFTQFNACLAIDPANYAALVNLGAGRIESGRLERAREPLERALAIKADGAEALVNLGYLDDLSDQWQKAVTNYLKAIADDPVLADAYANLGYDYGQHKFYVLAESALLKGIAAAPSSGRLHYLLAMAYANQGKLELARAQWQATQHGDDSAIAQAATQQLASLGHN